MMNAIKIAIKTETDAIAFYEEAALKTSHPVGKKMFLSIIEDEKTHLEGVHRILEGLSVEAHGVTQPFKKIKTPFERKGAAVLEGIRATTDELTALKVAVQMEKESIKLYEKLLKKARTPEERNFFERLLREEQHHYDTFSNTYSYLSDTGNWFMWEEHSIVDGGTPWA